jgi:hypothetical protein
MHAVLDGIAGFLAPLTLWLGPFSGVLWGETSPYAALFVTFLLGGWAAWMAGRACARTWRSLATLVFYLFLVGLATRFIHFSLFGTVLISFRYFVFDLAVVEALGLAGYRLTRTRQMARQYGWRYQAVGPFAWRPRDERPN